jgi:hypothetical protein
MNTNHVIDSWIAQLAQAARKQALATALATG